MTITRKGGGLTDDSAAALQAQAVFLVDPTTLASSPGSEPVATAATLSTVASLATSQTVLAANTSRRGVLMVNTDANALRIKYGATASASSFSVIISSGAYWEMPKPIYVGIIDGLWDADGSGSVFVTELT